MTTTAFRQSVVAMTLPLAMVACGDAAEVPDAPTATPVRTETIQISPTIERVVGTGIVASRAEMDLAFKVAGYVAEILADEGQRVREGQVLARLQSTETDARTRAAEARADLARKNLVRMERLFADSVVAEATLDEARDAAVQATSALEVALYNQEHATIRAPARGRILGRMKEVSEFSGPGESVFRFAATTSGWIVRIRVPDRHVALLSVGDSARVTLAALGSDVLAGVVTEIADAADPRSGTFEVEIRIANPDARIRSGMIARVEIELSEPVELAYLPMHALVDADGLTAAVFILDGETAKRRAVRVVRLGAATVGVEASGLAGATVITDGAAYLADGDRVDVREETEL